MADATGEAKEPLRVAFDRRLELEFHGAKITSDSGLLAYRELGRRARPDDDGRVGPHGASPGQEHPAPATRAAAAGDPGRLAGYEDVNDAERLARDPAMYAGHAVREDAPALDRDRGSLPCP
jgi:hypothetical protein